MAKIFISYNRQSREITQTLVSDLGALGHVVWFDQELSGGQSWWDRILSSVRDCDVFVFVLDEKSLKSAACHSEFGYAAKLGKPILPVLVGEGVAINLMPRELSLIQFVDYRRADRQSAFALARALAGIPPAGPLPNPLPTPPEVPVSYLGGLAQQVETAPSLSYEQQGAALMDLRRGLRDPEMAADARVLLERFRRRRDLFAAVAEEIDELRRASGTLPPGSPPVPQPATISLEGVRTRSLAAGAGALAGLILATIGVTMDREVYLNAYTIFLFAIPAFAIVGALVGRDRRLLLPALVGIVAGGLVTWSLVGTDHVLEQSAAVGSPSGAFLAVIVGIVVGRIRGRAGASSS